MNPYGREKADTNRGLVTLALLRADLWREAMTS